MAYQRKGQGNQGLNYHQRKAKVSDEQIARCLEITPKAYRYMKIHPFSIRLKYLILLSGILDVRLEELVYLIVRNKERANDSDKWYIDESIHNASNVDLNS